MKNRHFVLIVLLAIVALLFWWRTYRPSSQAIIQPLASTRNQPALPSAATQQSAATAMLVPTSQDNTVLIARRLKQQQEGLEMDQDQWRTPINFFGRVLDENERPVEKASIHFEWNDLSDKGTSENRTSSDAEGLFSLTGRTGKGMSLTITKDGYYTPEESRYPSFEYGNPYRHFVPEPDKPIVFHLRKKGTAEPLIHIQATLGGSKDFIISRDGTPVEISLKTGKAAPVGHGDLKVECWTDDRGKTPGQKYDWKCRITVPNGGILPYVNEFPFQAPLDGFQTSDEINMPATMDQAWVRDAKRSYFLKLANGDYARINFEMIAAGGHFFSIESFLNPSGSRNLEFDPDNTIQPNQ
jgi:hypothetical protein